MQVIQHDTGVILRNSESPEVLIFDTNQLPSVAPKQHFWQSCAPVNLAFFEEYGLKLITLRPLKSDYEKISDESVEIQNVYLMRYLNGKLPSNAQWIPIDEMPELDGSATITKAQILSAWDSYFVPDWFHYDWYDKITTAIKSFTDFEPKQIRTWERSTIWQIQEKDGKSYFKASPKMFSHEILLTNWLSEHFPENFPQLLPPLIPDTMRTADYGQVDLMSRKDLDTWQDAIQIYAKLQIAVLTHKQALLDMNVPQRGLDWIAERLEAFLMTDANLTRGERPLNSDEIEKLQSAMPRLNAAIQTLKECPIPETLEHGDLWAGQLIIHEGRIIITDWSDSAITFPFFSLPFVLTDIENNLPDFPGAKTILEDTYLEQWFQYGDIASLRDVFASANLISNIYAALRYHHDILPNIGQKWEMHNMIAYDMRLLLAKL